MFSVISICVSVWHAGTSSEYLGRVLISR